MSTYLARLVDRGVGVPGGAVSPRLGPNFQLSPAPGPPEEEIGPDLPPEAFVPGLPSPRSPVPHSSDVPAAAATAATVQTGANLARRGTERGSGTSRREPEPAVQRGRESTVPRLPATGEVAAAEPSPEIAAPELRLHIPVPDVTVATPSRVDAAGAPAQHRPMIIEGSLATPEGGPTAQAVPRPNVAHDPLPTRVGSKAGAPEPAPQIEVRIGRVEVRRPPEEEPVPWPSAAPQPAPTPGFDRLAAARRYVDRRWS